MPNVADYRILPGSGALEIGVDNERNLKEFKLPENAILGSRTIFQMTLNPEVPKQDLSLKVKINTKPFLPEIPVKGTATRTVHMIVPKDHFKAENNRVRLKLSGPTGGKVKPTAIVLQFQCKI